MRPRPTARCLDGRDGGSFDSERSWRVIAPRECSRKEACWFVWSWFFCLRDRFTLAESLAGVMLVPEMVRSRRLGPRDPRGAGPNVQQGVTMAQGTVKWFNPDKGFG